MTLGTVANACMSQRRAVPHHIGRRMPAGRGVVVWRALMSPYPGSQKREAEGRRALRLSDVVTRGMTALSPGWEVER